jgi:ATP-dependent phosphoenolpyruvate carboxykinase
MATPAETVKNNMTNTPDLSPYGIQNTAEIVYNPDYETLFAAETADNLAGFEIGKLTESGAIAVDTGDFTGRSPKDKYLVRTSRSTPAPGTRCAAWSPSSCRARNCSWSILFAAPIPIPV